jgi:hypothetical protein
MLELGASVMDSDSLTECVSAISVRAGGYANKSDGSVDEV